MAHSATAAEAPQNLCALERANKVRRARAEVKRRVGAGELTAAEVILSCPWQVRTMSVSELLVSQRSWGHVRSGRLLHSLHVPDSKQVGRLTERQRRALASVLTR